MRKQRRVMARDRRHATVWWRDARWYRGLSLVFLGGVVMLAATLINNGLNHLRDPQTLPIRHVSIDGDLLHLQRAQIEQALVPYVSGGFLAVDLLRIEQAARRLDWVYRARVRREWPDRLVVHITEQVPVAYWGEMALLNRYGELFAPAEIPDNLGLPRLAGRSVQAQELMQRFVLVQQKLNQVDASAVGLREDARGAWVIELANGTEILMGRDSNAARLERLLRVYPALLAQRADPIARIDLRYTNGMAVAWGDARREVAP